MDPNDFKNLSPFTMHDFIRISNKWECLNKGLDWRNSYLNFDDILQAISTLFIVSSSVQWTEIMYLASKSKGEDQPPDLYGDISVIIALLFMFIVIIGNFFI